MPDIILTSHGTVLTVPGTGEFVSSLNKGIPFNPGDHGLTCLPCLPGMKIRIIKYIILQVFYKIYLI
jgi:hypothetical protein